VLALFYLNLAESGGETMLSSSWTIYNELASTRPDIIKTLANNDWVHDTYVRDLISCMSHTHRGIRFGRIPPYHVRPLLHYQDNKPILMFSRRSITGSAVTPRTKRIPPISEAQAEALDALHFTAAKHRVALRSRPGDICFINNLALLHSRNAFVDSETSKRHLMRMWLSSPSKGEEIPSTLELAWDRMFEPMAEIPNVWDVDPFDERGRARVAWVSGSTLGSDGDGGEGNGGGGGGGGGTKSGRSTSCG